MNLAILMVLALVQQPVVEEGRHYWVASVDSLAAGRVKHTHVRVTGRIKLKRWESDGDLHIQIAGTTGFIVAECIPTSCGNCKSLEAAGMFNVGKQVTVLGITRYDGEHKWWEIHPVESVIEVTP